MNEGITIVDRGRGLQLSTCRIRVQDIVPYIDDYTPAQILEIMPVLKPEELDVLLHYIREHFEEVMEVDRQIRERSATHVNPPEVEESARRGRAKMEALREMWRLQKLSRPVRNGDHTSG